MRNEWSNFEVLTERQVKFMEACDEAWLTGQINTRESACRSSNLKGKDIIDAWVMWGACKKPKIKISAVEPVKLSEVFRKGHTMKVYKNTCWGFSYEKFEKKVPLKIKDGDKFRILSEGSIPELYDVVVDDSSFVYLEGDRLMLSTPIFSSNSAVIAYVVDDMGFTKQPDVRL